MIYLARRWRIEYRGVLEETAISMDSERWFGILNARYLCGDEVRIQMLILEEGSHSIGQASIGVRVIPFLLDIYSSMQLQFRIDRSQINSSKALV